MKNLSILLAMCCFHFGLSAQTIKTISATRQNWSGGIAGRSGSNFTFVIECSNYKEMPVPDTLWVEQEPTILDKAGHADAGFNVNTKCIITKRSARFQISATTVHDENGQNSPDHLLAHPAPLPHTPIAYKGVALLSYKYRGKQQYYTIRNITKQLPSADYP